MADTELQDFLKDLQGPEPSILDKPLEVEENQKADEEPEKEAPVRKVELDEDGYPKNRQGRRKRAQDDELRNEVKQLNERIVQLSEVDRFKQEVGDDHLKKVEAIFGTDTPEKLAATNLLKEALQGMSEKAKADAVAEWENRSGAESRAERRADSEVSEILEQVEEDYGLDFSNDSIRSGFITLMEKMSPKYGPRDAEEDPSITPADYGYIKSYADADAVAEAFVALQKRGGSNRAKELADRSMTRSGDSQPSTLKDDSITRFMEDNGMGW